MLQQQKDLLANTSEEMLSEEHRRRAAQGVITLYTLIRQQAELHRPKEYIYLDIGTLQSGQIFVSLIGTVNIDTFRPKLEI